ncbi:hypothetical protein [Verminephrobacter aporrectodeae]|uniref:hypothetical protein n=1 Tax=Verminephrobacter aporrectodeae TaxID=1110389 RepID=UPI0022377FE7|nr:hypothetical protein [Verminephrobacter aporrectodeae]
MTHHRLATLNDFRMYVNSGLFMKLAREGVAEAIAKNRALGLPVEGNLVPTKTLVTAPPEPSTTGSNTKRKRTAAA